MESNKYKQLIAELGKHFYNLGWASGTGGGISIKDRNEIYIAPSGVQKDRINPEDIFLVNLNGDVIEKPLNDLRISECTPIFLEIFKTNNSGAVIHSHSVNTVLVTDLFEDYFICKNLEMQKGIEGYGIFDELKVPIIENTSKEYELVGSIIKAIKDNAKTKAVLVNGHGIYVWGNSWEQTKKHAECYDYLFKVEIERRKLL